MFLFFSLSQNKRKANTSAWLYYLWGHGLMHGGGVYIVTGNVYLGLAEAVAHTIIDYLKCEGKFGMVVDQSLHMLCKLIWLGVLCLTY